MERSIESLRSEAPCIILMGMRGAGKTTLGQLAAEHLKAPFVDADVLFEERYSCTPKTFVAQHGWPAFREAETSILKGLLQLVSDRASRPQVISLGGGVVESEENRELLKKSWKAYDSEGIAYDRLDRRKGVAVIHVFREVDKVLMDRRGLPSWTGMVNGEEVWQRRRPWFRESSSHEFVNFTDGDVMEHNDSTALQNVESSRAARLRFEAVERDFVRFLIKLLYSYGEAAVSYKPSPSARSYLVTFPFADLKPHVDKLPLITLGADAVELRADLLHDPSKDVNEIKQDSKDTFEAYESPSLSFVSEQMALVRRHLPEIPLVFTLRTPAQGGRYPYPADAPTEALFTTLRHALKLGCDAIDIEMGMDAALTRALIADAKRRRITVLISWRDKISTTDGGFNWTSDDAMKLYSEAVAMGADLVKIVGTAGEVADNFALRMFVAGIEKANHPVPLSAYNMGYKGRISRYLNSTLASVTHPLAKQYTGRGVVGNPSMTFEEIQRALHLSGLTERASFFVLLDGGDEKRSVLRYKRWFTEMGLPYHVEAGSWPEDGLSHLRASVDPQLGDLRGIGHPRGVSIELLRSTSRVQIDANVEATTYFDCLLLADRSTAHHVAQNKLVEALSELISSSISPSVHLSSSSSCVILGISKEQRYEAAAICAVQNAGLGRVSLVKAHAGMQENSKPTVIVNCTKSAAAFDERLLSNENGGLYVDVIANEQCQSLVNEKRFRDIGWRSISAERLWRHVDALQFKTFTGRRAPSELSDVPTATQ